MKCDMCKNYQARFKFGPIEMKDPTQDYRTISCYDCLAPTATFLVKLMKKEIRIDLIYLETQDEYKEVKDGRRISGFGDS